MNFTEQIPSTAGRTETWSALTAVTTWPDWTPSMRLVEPLDSPEIAVGHRFRITQPGLPRIVWTVTEVRADESFLWTAKSPGVHTTAFHRLADAPGGGTRITIGIAQSGPLAGLVGALLGAKTRRYLGLEAAGLKAASEAVAADSPA